VLAADAATRRLLCEHVPSIDWDESTEAVAAAVDRWVAVQAAIAADGGVRRLREAGLPELPLATLCDRLRAAFLDGAGGDEPLPEPERAVLAELLRQLPAVLDRIAEARLPQTLVHGDLTPINWRRDGDRLVIIDWADAHLGHPATQIRLAVKAARGTAPSQSR